MRDFGASITHTYSRLRYETCLSKIFSCYYCKCKCCCRIAINKFIPPLRDIDKTKDNRQKHKPKTNPKPKTNTKQIYRKGSIFFK